VRILLIVITILNLNADVNHKDFKKPIKDKCSRLLKYYDYAKKYKNYKVMKRYKKLIKICNKH
jgi:hypothetical protein